MAAAAIKQMLRCLYAYNVCGCVCVCQNSTVLKGELRYFSILGLFLDQFFGVLGLDINKLELVRN